MQDRQNLLLTVYLPSIYLLIPSIFSSTMEVKDKENIKKRLALAILAVISENRKKAKENKQKGIKDVRLVDSQRKLAAASGIDFSNIQKITTGVTNPTITTIAILADGLNITISELFAFYDKISDAQVVKSKRKKTTI
jgi:DNA-binding XRE family transcriptional regulator